MAFIRTHEQKGIIINYIIIYLYIFVIASFFFATGPRADISLYYIINSKKDFFKMLQLYFCFEELARLQNTC